MHRKATADGAAVGLPLRNATNASRSARDSTSDGHASDAGKTPSKVTAAAKNALDVSSNAGAVIYGLIIVSVLLAAESAKGETYTRTVEAVVLALVLYWFAHGYSNLVTWRVRERRRLTAPTIVRTMLHELPLLAGAAVPLLVVVTAWAVGSDLQSALLAALWVDAATIVAVEFVAGIRAESSGRELLVQVLVGGALGVLILLLRLALH